MPTDKLLAARYDKFRRMGQFLEGDAAGPAPNEKRQAAVGRPSRGRQLRSHRNPNCADWPHSVLNRRKQR